ncbi:hypothetical protein BC831DRAFT_486901 [Entophlyctis helioformis]|nr:hypothetical protein BC831DRAFT_486901 [Entophlyctis helioformis]
MSSPPPSVFLICRVCRLSALCYRTPAVLTGCQTARMKTQSPATATMPRCIECGAGSSADSCGDECVACDSCSASLHAACSSTRQRVLRMSVIHASASSPHTSLEVGQQSTSARTQSALPAAGATTCIDCCRLASTNASKLQSPNVCFLCAGSRHAAAPSVVTQCLLGSGYRLSTAASAAVAAGAQDNTPRVSTNANTDSVWFRCMCCRAVAHMDCLVADYTRRFPASTPTCPTVSASASDTAIVDYRQVAHILTDKFGFTCSRCLFAAGSDIRGISPVSTGTAIHAAATTATVATIDPTCVWIHWCGRSYRHSELVPLDWLRRHFPQWFDAYLAGTPGLVFAPLTADWTVSVSCIQAVRIASTGAIAVSSSMLQSVDDTLDGIDQVLVQWRSLGTHHMSWEPYSPTIWAATTNSDLLGAIRVWLQATASPSHSKQATDATAASWYPFWQPSSPKQPPSHIGRSRPPASCFAGRIALPQIGSRTDTVVCATAHVGHAMSCPDSPMQIAASATPSDQEVEIAQILSHRFMDSSLLPLRRLDGDACSSGLNITLPTTHGITAPMSMCDTQAAQAAEPLGSPSKTAALIKSPKGLQTCKKIKKVASIAPRSPVSAFSKRARIDSSSSGAMYTAKPTLTTALSVPAHGRIQQRRAIAKDILCSDNDQRHCRIAAAIAQPRLHATPQAVRFVATPATTPHIAKSPRVACTASDVHATPPLSRRASAIAVPATDLTATRTPFAAESTGLKTGLAISQQQQHDRDISQIKSAPTVTPMMQTPLLTPPAVSAPSTSTATNSQIARSHEFAGQHVSQPVVRRRVMVMSLATDKTPVQWDNLVRQESAPSSPRERDMDVDGPAPSKPSCWLCADSLAQHDQPHKPLDCPGSQSEPFLRARHATILNKCKRLAQKSHEAVQLLSELRIIDAMLAALGTRLVYLEQAKTFESAPPPGPRSTPSIERATASAAMTPGLSTRAMLHHQPIRPPGPSLAMAIHVRHGKPRSSPYDRDVASKHQHPLGLALHHASDPESHPAAMQPPCNATQQQQQQQRVQKSRLSLLPATPSPVLEPARAEHLTWTSSLPLPVASASCRL